MKLNKRYLLIFIFGLAVANQAFSQLAYIAPGVSNYGAEFGLLLAILVGIVIIGGIKSIARVTDKVVPIMAAIYVGTALIIIFMNISRTGEAFGLIINGAFGENAIKGGFIGVLIVGFQRAAFSNEAGVGSAAIAHSAVKTDTPVTEGFVALLEPFVDTVVICTMTASTVARCTCGVRLSTSQQCSVANSVRVTIITSLCGTVNNNISS